MAFKKILLAYDHSAAAKAAMHSASGVASRFGSEITAVIVSGKDKTIFEDGKKHLEDFAAENKLNLEVIERHGSVYEEVVKLEKEGDYSLILLGSHGESGWKQFWAGSNAFKIISSSTCPVISVTEEADNPELKHILLPLADSRNTRQKVPYCLTLAQAFNSTVHILGVSKSSSDETKKHVRSYVHQTEKYLEERGIKTTVNTEFGVKVPEKCVSYAEEVNAGLMLIMTETESSGVFMDTYSQQLVNHSTVPVMSIHSRDTRLAGAAGY